MTHTLTDSTDTDIHTLLADRNAIAIIWCIEDVSEVRPDLSPEQCWAVLQRAKRCHDATCGISWETLEITAQDMYAEPEIEATIATEAV